MTNETNNEPNHESVIEPVSEPNVLLYENATGPVPYGLKNDYMFHVVFQENMHALKGLISSVLHIPEKSITSIQVQNPIEPGKSIDDKTFILDLKVIINNKRIINLELQISNERNWPDRSLGYLCRSYDNLNKGDDYIETKPAVHISFLNFTLFKNVPEFCAKYMLLNTKNHRIFTRIFSLVVVELNNTELATKEDLKYHTDRWAKLFSAETWEELKMTAGDDKAMQAALNELYKYNADEQIREQCEARERYYARKRYMENKVSSLNAEVEAMMTELEAKNEQIASNTKELAAKNEQIASNTKELAAKDKEIAFLREQLAKLSSK